MDNHPEESSMSLVNLDELNFENEVQVKVQEEQELDGDSVEQINLEKLYADELIESIKSQVVLPGDLVENFLDSGANLNDVLAGEVVDRKLSFLIPKQPNAQFQEDFITSLKIQNGNAKGTIHYNTSPDGSVVLTEEGIKYMQSRHDITVTYSAFMKQVFIIDQTDLVERIVDVSRINEVRTKIATATKLREAWQRNPSAITVTDIQELFPEISSELQLEIVKPELINVIEDVIHSNKRSLLTAAEKVTTGKVQFEGMLDKGGIKGLASKVVSEHNLYGTDHSKIPFPAVDMPMELAFSLVKAAELSSSDDDDPQVNSLVSEMFQKINVMKNLEI